MVTLNANVHFNAGQTANVGWTAPKPGVFRELETTRVDVLDLLSYVTKQLP
jgi:hypothetical protein